MEPLDDAYWSNRYVNKQTGWDMGKVSPPIKSYIDQLTDKHIAILIPGCGNAYEAAYLLEQGFTNITLLDIAPVLVKELQEKFAHYLGKGLHIVCADFFQCNQSFDLIIEQTFFCAIDPGLREAYAAKILALLNSGGKLVGVLFNTDFDGGPPFSGSKKEYENLFGPKFEIATLAECYNSILPRAGKELFVILVKA